MLLLVEQCLLLGRRHRARWPSRHHLPITPYHLIEQRLERRPLGGLFVTGLRQPHVTNQINPRQQLIRVNLVDKALGLMEGVVAEKVG